MVEFGIFGEPIDPTPELVEDWHYGVDDEATYVTKTGRVLTDADCWALAEEAERGYDPEKLIPRRADESPPETTETADQSH